MDVPPSAPEYTIFILNIARVYISQVQAALREDHNELEVMECEEVVQHATDRDWKANLLAIIADIERLIEIDDLPSSAVTIDHCRELAATRGYDMRAATFPSAARYHHHLVDKDDGRFLQNGFPGYEGVTFTTWQAYNHLLNLPRIV